VIPGTNLAAHDSHVAGRSNVFIFPLDDHSADSGMASLDAAPASTAPASWTTSQFSTFDRPSNASERVNALRRRNQLNERLITLGLLLVAVAAAAAVFIFSPR
jgi:hypothetical protein